MPTWKRLSLVVLATVAKLLLSLTQTQNHQQEAFDNYTNANFVFNNERKEVVRLTELLTKTKQFA